MRAFLATLLALVSSLAGAQSYPAKPIHAVVAFPPGGPVDIAVRVIAPA